MELKQLEYFQLAAQYESFTRAAEALYVTQPALSRSIRALEDELGHSLFDRKNQKILLNDRGKIFLQYVEQTFVTLGNGKKALDELENQERNTTMISVTQPDLYMELLESYLSVNSEVRILQPSGTGRSIEQQLLSHEIDFCISTPIINNPNIALIPLLRESLYLLVHSDHPLAGKHSVCLSEISNEPFIALTPGSGYRELIDSYFTHAGFVPSITYELNELAMIRKMVELGLGVGLYPASAYLRTTRQPSPGFEKTGPNKLCALRVTNPVCEREVVAYSLKGNPMSKAAAGFFEYVKGYFRSLEKSIQDMEADMGWLPLQTNMVQ